MHAALRSHFNTGVALAGAGAIALAPLVVPPPALPPLEKAVAQSVMQDTKLLAATGNHGVGLTGALDSLLGGLAIALNLDVTPDANGGVSLPDFIAALTARLTGGMAGNPMGALTGLLTLPITLVTGLLGSLPGAGATTGMGDVLGGLLGVGSTALSGIGQGITQGATLLAAAVNDTVTLFSHLLTGGATILNTATTFNAAAANPDTKQLAAVVQTFGPAATAVTVPGAGGSAAGSGSGSATVGLPGNASANARAATSGSGRVTVPDNASQTAKDVRGALHTSTNTGVNLGKEISGIASGKTDVTGGGSETGGGSVSGKASTTGSTTGQTASAVGGANGAAHADVNAHVHAHLGK